MALGTVKWFNSEKGYGFIKPDEGARDVFVHVTAVKAAGLEDLQEGQRLEFELQQGQDGKTKASGLTILDE
ncbi:MAG: cold-shock protein [Pseudomonadota bacterium]